MGAAATACLTGDETMIDEEDRRKLPPTGLPLTGLRSTGLPATGFRSTGLPATGLRSTGLPVSPECNVWGLPMLRRMGTAMGAWGRCMVAGRELAWASCEVVGAAAAAQLPLFVHLAEEQEERIDSSDDLQLPLRNSGVVGELSSWLHSVMRSHCCCLGLGQMSMKGA